ncbi:MAG: PEP-CTERM sorting domain-containing protein [Pontiellaceae bacterium]
MKRIHIFIAVLMTACFYSHASIIAFDDSSDPVYANGWGWQDGGSGFETWLWGGDWYTANANKYINSDIPGEQGFRLQANEGSEVRASRKFDASLNANETFSLNLGHIGGNDGELEIALIAETYTVFNIKLNSASSYWQAFDGSTFDLNDSNGMADYFTTDNENAEFTFTYYGGNNYGMTLTDSSGNGYNLDTKVATSVTASEMALINQVKIRNSGQGNGNNFYTDNLQIEVIPEPATLSLFGLFGLVGIFIRRKFAG